MHTIPELGTTVPAFLAKLWKLVENPENDDLICWAPNGRSFFIRNQARFARELLPHYYKHNNMASFVRQLNMYGFHKKVSVELGGLKCDKDEMEFAHQYFCRGHPYLVEHIKRKIASNKGQDPAQAPIKPELMNKMLTEVRSMRGRQEHLDSKLGAMKRENEALWRELAMLRQKHLKQQQIVNKLIHFLVTLVQPSRNSGLSVKRRYPLMIDDSNRPRKQSKMSKAQASPTGPVIHELDSDPDLDSQYIVAEMLENHQSPAVESPEHEHSAFVDDDHMSTIQLVDDSTRQLREEIQEIDSKKKRSGHKGKKKEETHLLEMPVDEDDEPVTIALLENEPISKPVPIATVRSSKLAAMAANMNKNRESQDQNIDLDSSVDLEEEKEDSRNNDNHSLIKLEDILIIPEIINEDHIQEHNNQNNESEQNIDNNNTSEVEHNSESNRTRSSESTKETERNTSNGTASTSSSLKDLSLSCVNPSGLSDATFRLGSSTEDVDNHLETMQTELDNLREILRGEGYSIDANTLLGLFGSDDPMSFGVPVNPELDPHSSNNEKDEEDHNVVSESVNGTSGSNDGGGGGGGGGEIMTYNSTPGLLDFDDIFLGATPSSSMSSSMTNTTNDFNTNNLGSTDPLDLEDSKNSLLDSLVSDSLVK